MSDQSAALAEAIARTETDETLSEGILMGYVCVAEWYAPDGGRWLTTITANGTGEEIPKWQTRGYLHESLFCWGPIADVEVDDE